jgi:3-oxoacyl-[acyl-carrier-protein] synthase II
LIIGCSNAGTAVLERAIEDVESMPVDWWLRYQKRWLVDVVAAALREETGIAIGPRTAVNTACSSGAVAVALGVDWLRAGDCDCILAIGTDELSRFTFSGFHALRAIDPAPCRPFDRSRCGLSMGEGAGCLVLERARDADRRRCANRGYVLSVGMSCDAYHFTAPDPEGTGAARALTLGLAEAGLLPDAIGFVNAHGTGTPLNDTAEVASIEMAFGAHAADCPVHSVKSTIGHCMAAAGAIEAIVALRSLETGIVPATAGLVDSEFDGRVHCVKGQPLQVRADYAISTNFGFGGNNAAMVLAHA